MEDESKTAPAGASESTGNIPGATDAPKLDPDTIYMAALEKELLKRSDTALSAAYYRGYADASRVYMLLVLSLAITFILILRKVEKLV